MKFKNTDLSKALKNEYEIYIKGNFIALQYSIYFDIINENLFSGKLANYYKSDEDYPSWI